VSRSTRVLGTAVSIVCGLIVLAASAVLARAMLSAWPSVAPAGFPLLHWAVVGVLAIGLATPWLALRRVGTDRPGRLSAASVCAALGYAAAAAWVLSASGANGERLSLSVGPALILLAVVHTVALVLLGRGWGRSASAVAGLLAAVAMAWIIWAPAPGVAALAGEAAAWADLPASRPIVASVAALLVLAGLCWLLAVTGVRRRWAWYAAFGLCVLVWPAGWFAFERGRSSAVGLARLAHADQSVALARGALADAQGDGVEGWRWVVHGPEWRPALILQPPCRVAVRAALPADGTLRFRVALPVQGMTDDDRSVRVRVTLGDGGDTASAEAVLAVASVHNEAGAWGTLEVSDPGQAGRETSLVIDASAAVPGQADHPLPLVALSEPPGAPRDAGPSCLFILVDTLRADRLGCYGYGTGTSPQIDRLADQGVLFERTVSACSWTTPSVASIFTGAYVATHGMDQLRVPGRLDHATLAEQLSAAGIYAVGVSANTMIYPGAGVCRGFNAFHLAVEPDTVREARARQVSDQAIALLRRLADRRFFLYLHYMDPHLRYDPPQKWAGFGWTREGRYLGEIAFCDAEIGRVLDALTDLGRAADTLVVFVADHGEAFEEHGFSAHGRSLYREEVHVPLILRLPDALPAGQRVATQVRTVDLFPTIARILGAKTPRTVEGETLLSLLADGADTADREAISETEFTMPGPMDPLISLNDGAHKLILTLPDGERWFYDVRADPDERVNLIDRDSRADVFEERLRRFLSERSWAPAAGRSLSDAERRRLRALGYLAPGGP